MKIIKNITDILEENDVKIVNKYEKEDKHFFISDEMILVYGDEDKSINVSFNVSIKPEFSANFMIYLKNELDKELYEIIFISDSFFCKGEKMYTGNKAYKKYNEYNKDVIINSMILEKREDFFMKSDYGFNC